MMRAFLAALLLCLGGLRAGLCRWAVQDLRRHGPGQGERAMA